MERFFENLYHLLVEKFGISLRFPKIFFWIYQILEDLVDFQDFSRSLKISKDFLRKLICPSESDELEEIDLEQVQTDSSSKMLHL